MADDFDDELYNVYNTAQEDAYSNTDIYAEDYKDASDVLADQNTSSAGDNGLGNAGAGAVESHAAHDGDHHGQNSSTGYDRNKDSTAHHDPSDDTDHYGPGGNSANAGGNPYQQQQQQQMFMNFPQQQQTMMGGWGQFQPNPYQYAMYQRAMQMAMNPYQMQQMMQRQMRQQQPHQHSGSSNQQSSPSVSGSVGNNEDNDQRQPPSVASAANQDEGKMFIGGLNWDTTDETLKQYFAQFGEVLDCVVMRDPTTGRSRGFGFLTMADPIAIDAIVNQDHYLDGKRIDPKRAIPREEQDKTEKIFVGGVSPDVNEDEFREFFTKFGNVIDATLMTDRDTGRPRGFGFITFEDSSGVDEALRQPGLAIKNKTIEVKKAMPKSKQMRQGMMSSGFGGSTGGGAGRGGYMPNSRYTGAASYGSGGRGSGGSSGYGGMGAGGAGGMYAGGMYGGYGNYNMAAAAAAYYGRSPGYGMGGSGGNGNMYGGNGVRGGSSNNQYDDDYQDHNDDYGDDDGGRSTRNDDRRRDHGSSSGRGSSSGGGAIHASQSGKSQHHYRPY